MKTGIELIAEERQRQIEKECWTPEHDDQLAEVFLPYAVTKTGTTLYKYIENDSRLLS